MSDGSRTAGFEGGVPKAAIARRLEARTRPFGHGRNGCDRRTPTLGGRQTIPGAPERLTGSSAGTCESSSWRGPSRRLRYGSLDPPAGGGGHREGVRGGIHRVRGLAHPPRPGPLCIGPRPPGPHVGRGVHPALEGGRMVEDSEGSPTDPRDLPVLGRELRAVRTRWAPHLVDRRETPPDPGPAGEPDEALPDLRHGGTK